MFVGHYAPAYAIRARVPGIPLWQLFLAAQAVDVLFCVLVPLGIERESLDPARPGMTAMVLEYMPYSHSLVATLIYGALIAAIGRDRRAVFLGLALVSHWIADLSVHVPDLPIAAGDGVRVGLGLWMFPFVAYVFEIVFLLAGFALYWREEKRGLPLLVALLVAETVIVWVAPVPPAVWVLSLVSLGSYLLFTALAWWSERSR